MSDVIKNMTTIQLQQQIDLMVKAIAEEYKPEKIILFGSAARGEMGPDSDVDLFIIKNDLRPRHQRSVTVRRILRHVNYRVPLDIVVYTPDELQERMTLGDWFVKDVVNDGRILYG